jgi:hypothetical protein
VQIKMEGVARGGDSPDNALYKLEVCSYNGLGNRRSGSTSTESRQFVHMPANHGYQRPTSGKLFHLMRHKR